MKKILLLALSILLVLSLSAVLFACDVNELPNIGNIGATPDNGEEAPEDGKGENAGEHKIESKSLTINDRNISGKFSYAIETFSFYDDITVTNCKSWVVSTDSYGMTSIATKTAPLAEGQNIFYIHITNLDETIDTYIVDLYRNHLYTVSFNTKGGTDVETQYVEEGNCAIEPTTSRVGYTFDSWNHDFSKPITSNTKVFAKWEANTDTKYVVEYYLENFENNQYSLVKSETENLTGTTDTEAVAEQKTFEHFTLDENKSVMRGKIHGKGSLVLKLYYSRNVYSVTNSNFAFGQIKNAGEYKYGTQALEITATPYVGCDFLGWYSDGELISTDSTIKFDANKNVESKFGVKAEMQNFDFSTNMTSCRILSVVDKSVSEIYVPDYVTKIENEAFRGCTNLENLTLPFINGFLGDLFGRSDYGYSGETYIAWIPEDFSFITSSYGDIKLYIPTKLKAVTVMSGKIPNGTFYGCNGLETITFGADVYQIDIVVENGAGTPGSSLGALSSLKQFVVDENNQHYKAIDGNLYTKDGKVLIRYVPKEETGFIIPSHVVRIGDGAFYRCNSLQTLVMPESVTSIGKGAFYNSSFKKITLGEGVTTIEDLAFAVARIESVTIPISVTSIGDVVFEWTNDYTVNYRGTSSQWEAISKGPRWAEWGYNEARLPDSYNYTGE